MKAYIHTQYGGSERLQLVDIDTPIPKDNEVLIEVAATCVNDWDLGILKGTPYLLRMSYGLFNPKLQWQIMGCDVAGTITAIGKDVTRHKVGDRVYGDLQASGFGAFAEYATAKEESVLPMPTNIDFVEAASLPHAATLAWQGFFDLANPQAGQQLLINGAGGGVGPVLVQLAKNKGMRVTGIDSAAKLEALKPLGFDRLFAYEHHDYTTAGNQYDIIYDAKITKSPLAIRRALKPGGTYVTIGGNTTRLLQFQALKKWLNNKGGNHFEMLFQKPNKGLEEISQLVTNRQLIPFTPTQFPFTDLKTAMDQYIGGKLPGRIVVRVKEP